MSIFLSKVAELSGEEAKNLGNQSAAIKDAGCHDLVIKKMFVTEGPTWESITVDFATASGETISYSGFVGVAKDTSPEAVEKAEAQTKRTMGDISRIIKAAGIPDIKTATAKTATEVDERGRAITVFTEPANKKLVGTTYTLIDGQKKDNQILPDKVFVKQELDTFKFLTKDGKNGLGRDSREAFEAEAKQRVEIAYGYEKNPKHIAKLNELNEKLVMANHTQPAQSLPGMPQATATASAVIPTSQDI